MTETPPACIAIDPGTGKVGLCLFRGDATVIRRRVISTGEFTAFLAEYPGIPLILGEGTGVLKIPAGHRVVRIDEAHSTQEGRAAWRKAYPLLALFEIFGYAPPSDGYAAEVIGRRAFAAGMVPTTSPDRAP